MTSLHVYAVKLRIFWGGKQNRFAGYAKPHKQSTGTLVFCSPLTHTRLLEMSSQRPLKIRTRACFGKDIIQRWLLFGNCRHRNTNWSEHFNAVVLRHVVALSLNRYFHFVSINTNDKPTNNRCAAENNHMWKGNGQVRWCVDIRLYCNVSQDSKQTSSFEWDDEQCRS
jgi:hypothetical protein